jgi:hypothetical protein
MSKRSVPAFRFTKIKLHKINSKDISISGWFPEIPFNFKQPSRVNEFFLESNTCFFGDRIELLIDELSRRGIALNLQFSIPRRKDRKQKAKPL